MIADRYEYELYTNKTLIAVIEEGAFGGTCFREIYFNVNCKWYRKSWKEFVELKYTDKKFYSSNYFNMSISNYFNILTSINMALNVEHLQVFGKINAGLILQILMDGFNGILCMGQVEDLYIEIQIAQWNGIVSRFKGKLVEEIKNVNGRFDDIPFHLRLDTFYCFVAFIFLIGKKYY